MSLEEMIAIKQLGCSTQLRLFSLFLFAVLCLPACSKDVKNEESPTIDYVHVLSRIGYGPDTWHMARIAQLGISEYIEEQLEPEQLDDSNYEAIISSSKLQSLELPLSELEEYYCYGCPGAWNRPLKDLQIAKILRSVHSRRQLEAVLTDFWFNHFNILGRNTLTKAVVTYERDAIRPFVLGSFEDMLLATAKSPGMLLYLDNAVNFKNGFILDEQEYGINENFAREILELHTVGVHGGYSQQDIIEVARCLTGWTVDRDSFIGDDGSGFEYWDHAHDKGAKQINVGGQTLSLPEGGGYDDGVKVIRFLARHPTTANRICERLVRRFISENPPESVVSQASDVYLQTNGDIRAVMPVILSSPEFFEKSHYRNKVKRPLVYVASLIRATGVVLDRDRAMKLYQDVSLLGEPLYGAGPPTGYPDASAHWIGAGALLNRFNLALTFLEDKEYSLQPNWDVSDESASGLVDALVVHIIPDGIDNDLRVKLIHFADNLEIERQKRIANTAALLFSSQQFLTH